MPGSWHEPPCWTGPGFDPGLFFATARPGPGSLGVMADRRRVGIIGAGRIGGAVAAWLAGRDGWVLAGVLVRDAG
jgi:hypothetical protein